MEDKGDPAPGSARAAVPDDLRLRWERFSGDDAMFFITGWDREWTVEDFFASGREIVSWFDEWTAGVEPGRMLEVGCGLGRTAAAWASRFREVQAVDISEGMVERARSLDPPANLHFSAVPGDGSLPFESGHFDLCFSYVVFQHIRDEAVIAAYLREIGRVLAPGGRAILQFDTRPRGLAAILYERAPDRLLSRARRRGMRRYRRDPGRLGELFAEAGLRVAGEQRARTDKHYFLLEAVGAA